MPKLKWKKTYIKSMNELILHYEEAIRLEISKSEFIGKFNKKCLLCRPIGISFDKLIATRKNNNPDNDHNANCENQGCPWIVMTGNVCDEQDDGQTLSIYQTASKPRMSHRIEQLKEWIKYYES